MRIALTVLEHAAVGGACEVCSAKLPPFALYKPLKAEPAKKAICGACINAHAEATATIAVKVVQPWETEAGKFLKAQRNIALDNSLWALLPGSPLTAACQAAYIEYRTKLHRMTVDAASPQAWTWPKEPTHEYLIPASQPTISATGAATAKITGAK